MWLKQHIYQAINNTLGCTEKMYDLQGPRPRGGVEPNWCPVRRRYDTEYASQVTNNPNQTLERLTRDENKASASAVTIEDTQGSGKYTRIKDRGLGENEVVLNKATRRKGQHIHGTLLRHREV